MNRWITALALAGKWDWRGARTPSLTLRGSVGAAAARPVPRSCPRAAAPRPRRHWERNQRRALKGIRIWDFGFRNCLVIGAWSFLCDRFVHVQDCPCRERPGGAIDGVAFAWAGDFFRVELLGCETPFL